MENVERSKQLAMMLRGILAAEGDAIGCEECFEQLDRCADLIEAGRPFDEVYPEVKQHLEDCICCAEEFEALLTALHAAFSPMPDPDRE